MHSLNFVIELYRFQLKEKPIEAALEKALIDKGVPPGKYYWKLRACGRRVKVWENLQEELSTDGKFTFLKL